MKFNLKKYQKQKTKQYLRNNNFLILSINANQNSENWVLAEQELRKLQIIYYKICNKTTKTVMKNSTNKNIANIISSTFFLLKPATEKTRISFKTLQLLDLILFTILVIKLNKKTYTVPQFKNAPTLNHKKNMAILYQFLLTSTKLTHFKKI